MISDLWLFGADVAAPEVSAKAPESAPSTGVDLDLFGGGKSATTKPVSDDKEFYSKCDRLASSLTLTAKNEALKVYALRLRSLVWEMEEAYYEGRLDEARQMHGDEARMLAAHIAGVEGDALLRLVCSTWVDASPRQAVVI